MNIHKPFFLLVNLLWLFLLPGCESNYISSPEDCLNYDYTDCNTSEPSVVPLHIKLSINSENPVVPITIFRGKLENNNIILSDTVNSSSCTFWVAPDNYYTVEARYRSGNNMIYAYDGDNVKKIRNQVCDSVCWTYQEGNVNVELR
ncbi:MAG TPA: hypothetical protein PLB59_05160 [Bacteroidales bacterium]|nr:hypothetical protein [Bacteroidales bacterium]HQN15988.1 hypothetical protein [Bacteroidales bacterium]HQP15333.1 hypothetical protein [Bacteroidales bacterium]